MMRSYNIAALCSFLKFKSYSLVNVTRTQYGTGRLHSDIMVRLEHSLPVIF